MKKRCVIRKTNQMGWVEVMSTLGTHLCSFKSNSKVDMLFTMFLCSFRKTCMSLRTLEYSLSGFAASTAIAN